MPGETAWISADYVKLSGTVGNSETQVAEPTTATTPAPTTETGAEAVTAAPTTEVKADPMAESSPRRSRSTQTKPTRRTPPIGTSRPSKSMYSDIEANSTNSINKELARNRLKQIDAFESVKAHDMEINKVGEDLQKKLTTLEKQRQEELIRLANVGAKETPYAAVGVVEKFFIAGLGWRDPQLVNDDSIDFLVKSSVVDLNSSKARRWASAARSRRFPDRTSA